jgi:hypothetical protein
MVQILNFSDATHSRLAGAHRYGRGRQVQAGRVASDDDFTNWPELSSGSLASRGPMSSDPANSPQRVLTEALFVLGSAGLLVLLTTAFLGAPQ